MRGLTGDVHPHFKILSTRVAGKLICSQLYRTGVTPSHSTQIVAWRTLCEVDIRATQTRNSLRFLGWQKQCSESRRICRWSSGWLKEKNGILDAIWQPVTYKQTCSSFILIANMSPWVLWMLAIFLNLSIVCHIHTSKNCSLTSLGPL